MCEHVYICLYVCFFCFFFYASVSLFCPILIFLVLFLFYLFIFLVFVILSMHVCFLMRIRKGMYSDGKKGG